MDHMEYSIALPPHVESTNAGAEWMAMKQRHFNHLNPNTTSFHQSFPPNLFTSFLISISLEQVQEVFNMLGLSVEEALRFNKILKSIEDLCLPRFLIIYNRYRFLMCKQNGPEFNGFLQQLLAWSDLCEFGELKDILLKDSIISGITEESIRQRLLRTEQLDFNKTVEICKAGLVKHHGSTENTKTMENIFVDAWTSTCTNITENNSVCKLQMVDKAIGTFVAGVNKETQTDCIIVFTSDCGGIEAEEKQLTENPTDSILVNYIDNHSLCVSDIFGDSISLPLQIQNDSDIIKSTCIDSNQKNNEVEEKNLPSDEIDLDLNLKMRKCIEYDFTNVRRSLRTRKIIGSIPNNEDNSRNVEDNSVSNTNIQEVRRSEHTFNSLDDSCLKDQQQLLPCNTKKKSKFECKVCGSTLADAASFKNHKAIHQKAMAGVKKYQCKFCSSSFNKAAHLKVHTRLHTGERPFVCNVCGKGYAEASKLKNHKRNHTGERPYKCPDCPLSFKWSAAFIRHKRTHNGERPYKCEKCISTFADLTSLQRHTRTHTKNRPYKCMCGSSFTDSSALREHKRIHTEERPFPCSICGASFIRAQHLKEHKKIHTGEKPFECETCHAKFTEASKLKSHRRRHTGEKPYVCKICGKCFSWTASYNRHMKTHTLEKPYVCQICRCAFADNSTLVRHRRTHTGERPYHCTQCLSSFADSSSLSRHRRIHRGDKPFSCDICSASFTVKSYLNRHLRIHTGEKPFECNVCSAKFGDSSKLNRHQKIHAKSQNDQTMKAKSFLLWETPVETDSLLPNSELSQLQEQDIGQYFSRQLLHFDPPQGRPDQDFEDIPVASSVLDDILNIKP